MAETIDKGREGDVEYLDTEQREEFKTYLEDKDRQMEAEYEKQRHMGTEDGDAQAVLEHVTKMKAQRAFIAE